MDFKKIINSAFSLLGSGLLLFYVEGWMPVGDTRWLILAIVSFFILVIINWADIRNTILRRHHSRAKTGEDAVVDDIGAWGIIDAYIGAAMVDKRDGVKLTIRRNILDRFSKVTGAKLGEYEYNRELLHHWLQSNAARFLIENRKDLI